MSLKDMTEAYRKIARACMSAILEGPFIDEWEFHSRLGITRGELRAALERWPNLDDSVSDSADTLAVNNCLNEVCNGITIADEAWSQWFSVKRAAVKGAHQAWKRQ